MKMQKTWQCPCKSKKNHGIINLHFQKTWYDDGENLKKPGNTNVKVQKAWYYQSTFPKNMVLLY